MLPAQGAFAAKVEGYARDMRGGTLGADIAGLRYGLRRDGFTVELAARSLSLAHVTVGASAGQHVLAAAGALLRGAVVEIADPRERRLALLLAALARAMQGSPVHWLTVTEERAKAAAAELRAPLGLLNLPADAVRCAPLRAIAFDYLRDRLQAGPRSRAAQGRIERLAGDAAQAAPLRLSGLHCALVEDADTVMLDEAHAPLVMAAEADLSGDRLVYEQAMELARALTPGADFEVGEDAVQLGAEGSRRLAQLSVLLGAVWSSRARREELVGAALAALHLGREPNRKSDILYRMTVPRFLGRYLHLAGVCRDARGAENEFWELYRLKTVRAGAAAPRADCPVRVFRTAAQRRSAIAAAAGGAPLLVAMRTKAEAEALPQGLAVSLHPAQREVTAPPPVPPHLVVAELHDSHRHVAQIREAYGAASCVQLLAMEDEAVEKALGAFIKACLRRTRGELPPGLARWVAGSAQTGLERAQAQTLRELVARERQIDELVAFSGRRE